MVRVYPQILNNQIENLINNEVAPIISIADEIKIHNEIIQKYNDICSFLWFRVFLNGFLFFIYIICLIVTLILDVNNFINLMYIKASILYTCWNIIIVFSHVYLYKIYKKTSNVCYYKYSYYIFFIGICILIYNLSIHKEIDRSIYFIHDEFLAVGIIQVILNFQFVDICSQYPQEIYKDIKNVKTENIKLLPSIKYSLYNEQIESNEEEPQENQVEIILFDYT